MKIRNIKKVMVSTMALAMGAALAGSISGTVAWYQYSTRANVSYVGTSKHNSHNLQISLDGTNWGSSFTSSALIAAATHKGTNFSPVTNGAANDGDDALGANWYGNPKAGNFLYSKWGAADANAYLQFDLYFRVLDVNGDDTPSYRAIPLYLSDVNISTSTSAATKIEAADFANAFRMHVANRDGSANLLLANDAYTTKLNGMLDLNNDGVLDSLKDSDKNYEWNSNADPVSYGSDSDIVQTTKNWSSYIADDSGSTLNTTGVTKLADTTTSGAVADCLKLTFTIWMEGWAGLANGATGNADSSEPYTVWDVAKYIGDLRIGLQFSVAEHADH